MRDENLELIKTLSVASPAKIVMLVIDGLGGLAASRTSKSELETAETPNLDRLAAISTCGLTDPVGPGITPGSAPGHLALFGYSPIRYNIGRGVLEATGIEFDLLPGDVAARGNFCTVDDRGLISDRRAGRISSEKAGTLCRILDGNEIDGVKILVAPVREHRFVAVFRGSGLAADLSDSDPGRVGVEPESVRPLRQEASRLANVVNKFLEQARGLLADHLPANMVTLRGFSQHPSLPTMGEVFKLKPAAIAVYPMYRGLARLVGMHVLATGSSIEDELTTLTRHYDEYDFFFVHIKRADTAGEDGDFAGKVRVLEEIDRALPALTDMGPDVIVVAGDHSTPAVLKGHSWHPVPFLLHSPWCRSNGALKFTERDCATGELGRFPATQVMPLAMAHALKLIKFGA